MFSPYRVRVGARARPHDMLRGRKEIPPHSGIMRQVAEIPLQTHSVGSILVSRSSSLLATGTMEIEFALI